MRPARVALALALLALTGAGCAEAPPHESAAIELGTGSWRFEPLEDGQEVELVRGAQGGWHMWISVRVRGLEGDALPLRLTMQPADESAPPSETEIRLRLDLADDEGWRKLVGYTGVVNEPSCLVGELMRVRVSTPMDDGTTIASERDVRVLGGAYPPEPCSE